MNTEKIILSNLMINPDFIRKALPHLKEEYFTENKYKIVFCQIKNYIEKYNKRPSFKSVLIDVENKELNESDHEESVKLIKNLSKIKKKENIDWLIDTTEDWCKDRSVYNAIMQSISIYEGDGKSTVNQIPSILEDALSVSFDLSMGHNYFDDAEERFEFYTKEENKIPFDIDIMNKITNGGLTRKTLLMLMATTGGGKTAMMCHQAVSYVAQGYNVVYFTLEMAEELLGQRMDANFLDVDYNSLKNMNCDKFLSRIKNIQEKSNGKLIIQQYPAHVTNSSHFKLFLKELWLKEKIKPDVIIVDYLQICGSSRFKPGMLNHSYYLKAVAEELRAMAIEFDCVMISASQFNREGMSEADPELEQVSESIGITHTADLMLGIVRTEEFDQMNQVIIKQLKNRYNDLNYYRRFNIGMDLGKSKFYDLSDIAQEDMIKGVNTNENKSSEKFSGFKV